MQTRKHAFWAGLRAAGLPEVPGQFAVAFAQQSIPHAVLAEIDEFIDIFEGVTTRSSWQEHVTRTAPMVSRQKRSEVCFFSAWDFHLPPRGQWQVIEFNDNGSGLLFAVLINRLFYDIVELESEGTLETPAAYGELARVVADLVATEATRFFGSTPSGLFLILDDAQSLSRGTFLREMEMLQRLLQSEGREVGIGSPEETEWKGGELLFHGRAVSFVVNRGTDFFWQGENLKPVRDAYLEGNLYVAPNPYTYATRSDKRLLEFLSLPNWDRELGILPHERTVLSSRVPETHLLREDNMEELAERKEEFIFKPTNANAGRGFLPSTRVGHSRLKRLLKKREGYVAQKKVFRPTIRDEDGGLLWTDLRVWAYRGQRILLSGRASVKEDGLELRPPGGWLPTFELKRVPGSS